MKIHKVLWIVVLSFLGLTIIFSSCSPIVAPRSMVDVQAEIEEAVKATVIAMSVEEQMAAEQSDVSGDASGESSDATAVPPTATEVPPTATPFPSPTPTATATTAPSEPTSTPQPTATLIAAFSESSNVLISADVNTNCRLGPSRAYRVDGYLLTNEESTVHGQDAGEDWWYIANPTKDEKYCWVWTETTDVEGSTDNLPVIEPPPMPKRKDYAYYGYSGCYGYPYYSGCPIRMKYDDGWGTKWYGYDIKPAGCQKWDVCKYKYSCDVKVKYVDDCCRIKVKTVNVCKRYCLSPTCTIKQINKGKCEPVCCKW